MKKRILSWFQIATRSFLAKNVLWQPRPTTDSADVEEELVLPGSDGIGQKISSWQQLLGAWLISFPATYITILCHRMLGIDNPAVYAMIWAIVIGNLMLQTFEYFQVCSKGVSVALMPYTYWIPSLLLILCTGGFHSPYISISWQTWTIALSSFPGTEGRPQLRMAAFVLFISYIIILLSHLEFVTFPQFPIEGMTNYYLHFLMLFSITFQSLVRGENFRSFISKTLALERGVSVAKSTFLANISHEMRTPLTSIIGASELIIRGDQNDVKMDYLLMIKSCAEKLLQIVNDLLDISTIDRGKLMLHNFPFNLYELLQQIVKRQFQNTGPAVVFKPDIKIDRDLELVGDTHRLTQVLQKFLNNATKFTSEGEICFSAEVLKRENDRVTVEFIVKDTGIGISEEDQKELFSTFFQGKRSQEIGGMGLGLTICHEVVQALGGSIKFQSTVGVGTTFRIAVSFREGPSSSDDRPAPDSARQDFPTTFYESVSNPSSPHVSSKKVEMELEKPKVSILVVEDNIFNQQLLKSILSQVSNDVDTADNGERALDRVADKEYDLIFMDIQMPVKDGIEATKAIRANNKNVQIVGLTANCDDLTRIRAMQAGMNSLIFKPVRFDDLNDIVRRSYRRKSI